MTHQELVDKIDLDEKWQGDKPRFTFWDAAKGLEVTDRKTGKVHFLRGYNYWLLYREKTRSGPSKTSRTAKARLVSTPHIPRRKQARARLTRE